MPPTSADSRSSSLNCWYISLFCDRAAPNSFIEPDTFLLDCVFLASVSICPFTKLSYTRNSSLCTFCSAVSTVSLLAYSSIDMLPLFNVSFRLFISLLISKSLFLASALFSISASTSISTCANFILSTSVFVFC